MDSVRAERMTRDLKGLMVGNWIVEDLVGNGKSALVFRGRRESVVGALKVFDPELIERFGPQSQLRRVERELSLVGQAHPNLVQILDGGMCERTGLLYVVMGFFEWKNLSQVLAEFPRGQIWPVIHQVAEAARYLETLSIAHRDIKIDNIVISADFRKAVLLDLGVLKPFGADDLTDKGQKDFIATKRYAPPDLLWRDEENNPDGWRAVTFYQLGGVLHDLIMRKRLFGGHDNPEARLVEAVRTEIPVVSASDVPATLTQLARNCLIKDPKTRLEVVKWEHFTPPVTEEEPAKSAKERVIQRVLGRSQVHANTSPEDLKYLSQKKICSIASDMQEMARRECVSSRLFPPVEIIPIPSTEPVQGCFVLCFTTSERHAVDVPLYMWFKTVLESEKEPVISIEFAFAMGRLEGPIEEQTPPLVGLYRGVFDRDSVRSLITKTLYRALDKAQEQESSSLNSETDRPWEWLSL